MLFLFYILQRNDEFTLTSVLEGNDPLYGWGSWDIASGPYEEASVAGKALVLAIETWDDGNLTAWLDARSQLQEVLENYDEVVEDIQLRQEYGVIDDVVIELAANWITATGNLRQLLVDWEVD